MNSVEGKIALISGGARGLGGMSAIKLAEAGAKVIVTEIRRLVIHLIRNKLLTNKSLRKGAW